MKKYIIGVIVSIVLSVAIVMGIPYLLDENKVEGENFSIENAVQEYEKELITAAVESSESLAEAAAKLGISRQNLNYKLKKYSLNEGYSLNHNKYNL